jgi:hypothetical protein
VGVGWGGPERGEVASPSPLGDGAEQTAPVA